MKKIVLLLCILSGGIGSKAQDKNIVVDANAEVRKTNGFNAIDVSGAINLYISQGTEEAVAVSASSDEVRERIRTEVRGGKLVIYFDSKGMNWRSWGNHKMKAYVTYKSLNQLEASGASTIHAADPVRLDALRLDLSGASDFRGAMEVKDLRINAAGASVATISGTALETKITASGACNIRAYDLKTDKCSADASGASNIRITVEKELNAQASGGSTIFFRGNGLIRDLSASGGATVKRRSDD